MALLYTLDWSLAGICHASFTPTKHRRRTRSCSAFAFNHRCRWQQHLTRHCRCRSSMAEEGPKFDATEAPPSSFCIIEGPETVQDFGKMQLQEIQDNIRSRRNKIFLHMEEIRRLRIQQRIKNAELGIMNSEVENEMPNFPSFIPFLPPLTPANLKLYYASCFSLITGIIIFGGLLAPTLELKLGLGGTTYEDFIRNVHLPMQLSQVDPIVASFSGGAVGVISALMVVEINNVKQQEHKRCRYCLGTGYLACARCSSSGALVFVEPVATVNGSDRPLSPPIAERCPNCLGAGKNRGGRKLMDYLLG
ncbi:protein ORANGE, chloroplastic isoform X2 [Cryptomeria japonica]|uniref:protein ORANGE, chloroplastic isoform X2 n=1 Tax=Cryptomeria japonica TaxID=3369 RepID=UPI0025AB7DB4|nr:protein ORANGE, chloroplastic isoform X2 [Cryptomeria japonica]